MLRFGPVVIVSSLFFTSSVWQSSAFRDDTNLDLQSAVQYKQRLQSAENRIDVVLQTRDEIDEVIRNFPSRGFGYIELGKVVRPLSSYLDVSITRFEVPALTALAIFELSAYKRPRNCVQHYANETIVVYFQHGSTPLLEEDFFPLPAHVYKQRTHLYRSTMAADQRSHYLKLAMPLPGDWFSVAFLDPMLSLTDTIRADSSDRLTPAELRYLSQSTRKCSIVLTSTMHVAPWVESYRSVAFQPTNAFLPVETSNKVNATLGAAEKTNKETIPASAFAVTENKAQTKNFVTFYGNLSASHSRVVYRLPPPDGLFCSLHIELHCPRCRLKFRNSAPPKVDGFTDTIVCAASRITQASEKNNRSCLAVVACQSGAESFISLEVVVNHAAGTEKTLKDENALHAYNLTIGKFCCPIPLRESYLRPPVVIDNNAVEQRSNKSSSVPALVKLHQEMLCPATYERLSRVDYGLPFSSRFFIKRSILPFLQDLLFIPIKQRSVQAFEFELTPLDSGGTFWFRLDAQPPYSDALGSGKIDVQFCLGMHAVPLQIVNNSADGGEPEVWCDAASVIEMRVENVDVMHAKKKYVWEIFVPYPEPGAYYLMVVSRPIKANRSSFAFKQQDESVKLHATFANNEKTNGEKINSDFATGGVGQRGLNSTKFMDDYAEPEKHDAGRDTFDNNSGLVVIQFQAMLQQCFDGTACGHRGRCRLSLLGGSLVSSACECFNGYRGLDCSDAARAVSDKHINLAIVALTLSNVVYVPAAVVAWRRHYRLESVIYLATALFSTLYHLCDRSDEHSVCVSDYHTLQFADFYAAVLSVWLTIVALAELPPLVLQLTHLAGSIGIAIAVRHNATAIYAFLIPCVVGILILFASWLYRKLRLKCFYPSVHYLILHFMPGIAVAIAGLFMFGWLQTEINYKWVHSSWHVIMGVAIVIILPTRKLRYGSCSKSKLATCEYQASLCDAAADNASSNCSQQVGAVVTLSAADAERGVIAAASSSSETVSVTIGCPLDDGDAQRHHECQSRNYHHLTVAPANNNDDDDDEDDDTSNERLECVSFVDSCTEHAAVVFDNVVEADDDCQKVCSSKRSSPLHVDNDDCSRLRPVTGHIDSVASTSSLSLSSSGGCHTPPTSLSNKEDVASFAITKKNTDAVLDTDVESLRSAIPAIVIFNPVRE